MTQKWFEVAKYSAERSGIRTKKYTCGDNKYTVTTNGMIKCQDSTGAWRLWFIFLTPDSAPAENYASMKGTRGYVFAPTEDYPHVLDLLRNESPIWAYVNFPEPKRNKITTHPEAVGEEETRRG